MCWAIMTIDAVHLALAGCGNLVSGKWSSAIVVLSNIALSIFDLNPGNYLPVIVGGDVGNFIGNVHVPVDACYESGGGTASADVYQHASLAQGVFLVVAVTIEDFHLGPKKLFGPVTLFAGFRSRPEVVHRRADGPRVLIKRD